MPKQRSATCSSCFLKLCSWKMGRHSRRVLFPIFPPPALSLPPESHPSSRIWLSGPHYCGFVPGSSGQKNPLPCPESSHLYSLRLLFTYVVKCLLYFKLLLVFINPFAIKHCTFPSSLYLDGRSLEGRRFVFLRLPEHDKHATCGQRPW